jgi:hypothetical protein
MIERREPTVLRHRRDVRELISSPVRCSPPDNLNAREVD